MRPRRWIIILAVLTALTTVALYHGWNLLKVEERLKEAFLTELRPIFEGQLDIAKLQVDLGAVHLKGVNIRWKNDLYSLWVDDIRVGYNIIKLIKHGFNAPKCVSGVILTGPQFTLRSLQDYGNHPIAEDEKVTEIISEDNYQKGLASLDYINRLVVSKGKVVMQDSSGQRITLARDIDGWINSQNLTHASARMAGKLFSSRSHNLSIRGTFNIAKGRLDTLWVELSTFKMTEGIPLFVPSYLKLTSGIINGKLVVTEKGLAPNRKPDVSGELHLSNGSLEVTGANLFLKDIQYSAQIKDWDFILKDASQEFNGSKVQVSGKINNILNPQFDLKLVSNQFDIGKFLKYLYPQFPFRFSGVSSLQLALKNSYENPQVHASIYAHRVNFDALTFRNLRGRVSLKDSLLNVEELKALASKSQIKAAGFIDFSSPARKVDWKFVSDGDIHSEVEKFVSTNLKSCEWSLEARVFGELKHPQTEGQMTITALPSEGETLKLCANYSFHDDKLKLRTDSVRDAFYLDGEIAFAENDPYIDLTVNGLGGSLWNVMKIPLIKDFLGDRSFNVAANGRFSDLDFEVKGFESSEKISPVNFLSLRGKLRESKKGIRNIAAKIDYSTTSDHIEGQFNCVQTRDFIKIRSLRFGDFLKGKAKIALSGEKPITAEISIDKAELNQLAHVYFGDGDFKGGGKVYGEILVDGTFSQPQAHGNFTLTEGTFNGVGDYEGEASFNLSRDKTGFANLSIRRNGSTVLYTQGWSDFKDGGLDFYVNGSEINSQSLLQTFTGRKGGLEGLASFGIEIKGTRNRPIVSGEISVEKGKLLGLDFDKAKIKLSDRADEVYPDSDLDSQKGRIKIAQLDLQKENQYHLQAYGIIPLSTKGEMDLHLTTEGSLFSLLPKVAPFFQEAQGNGRFACRLIGSPESPIVDSGTAEFSNGWLKLAFLTKEIKNVNARIEIPPGSRFVEITDISGEIKDHKFRLYNVDSTPECSRKLQPLIIPGLDLNLGICILETSPKGIPLNIPGLMAKGEVGWFETAGKSEREKFYLAGPIENPTVRGTVKCKGVHFTYPFIQNGGSENFSASFLEKIDWDLSVRSVKDNHYIKEIPSLVDNVYINLVLDDLISGLDFTGIIEDGSFKVQGNLASTRGSLEYLDLGFWVEEFGAEFDGVEARPIVYGRAKTTVTDSLGFPSDIYLTLHTVDETTGEEKVKGRWGDIRFGLSSNNPNIGRTQGEILAALGYSTKNLREKATDLIGISTDNLVFRPLFRPFERILERSLGFDMVRFTSRFARNLMQMNSNPQIDPRLFLFRSTRVMVGKYLADNLFVVYSGQLQAGLDPRYQAKGMGIKHSLGIEYRINPGLLLEFEYGYDSLLLSRREDKRIRLRHSFPF